jgi:hypothetical protein
VLKLSTKTGERVLHGKPEERVDPPVVIKREYYNILTKGLFSHDMKASNLLDNIVNYMYWYMILVALDKALPSSWMRKSSGGSVNP